MQRLKSIVQRFRGQAMGSAGAGGREDLFLEWKMCSHRWNMVLIANHLMGVIQVRKN